MDFLCQVMLEEVTKIMAKIMQRRTWVVMVCMVDSERKTAHLYL